MSTAPLTPERRAEVEAVLRKHGTEIAPGKLLVVGDNKRMAPMLADLLAEIDRLTRARGDAVPTVWPPEDFAALRDRLRIPTASPANHAINPDDVERLIAIIEEGKR